MTSIFVLEITEIPEGSLSATMMVDGKPFGEESVDLAELKRSAAVSGAYDLQTCSCGTPQCAGFWEPIFVQHSGDFIRWEFDGRYHPTVVKDENAEATVILIEFNRIQYITEIREKFQWLCKHSGRGSIGPRGFSPAIFDEEFPDPAKPQLPFAHRSIIVVGYSGEYRQPWVWVDENPDVYPKALLPSGYMWDRFGYWATMWDSSNDYGLCLYKKDSIPFQLRSDVSISECNKVVEDLAREVQRCWGASAKVLLEMVEKSSPMVVKRFGLT